MQIRALLAALTLAVTAAGMPARAVERDAPFVARGLQAWIDQTRDLRARFEQTVVSGAFGADVPETGTLLLLRPGRMRWDYARPETKVAILEGERTVVYLPEDRQWIRGKLPSDSGSLHTLLAGTGRVADLFSATLEEAAAGSDPYRLRLVPREESEGFHSVVLELAPKTFEILGAEIIDPAGNRIRYRFSGLRRNRGIPEDAFHLEPPPGTEIIDAP